MGLMKNFLNSSAFALACLLFAGAAQAFTPFVVREIRAEGLVRLELGTLLTYLPLSEGDEINTVSARQAIRSLYATGLFEDVQLDKDGDALVIRVTERPAIVRFEIEGNSKVGGDELDKSLKELGLAEGELFRRELLDQVQQELERQYFANGYYDVQIDTTLDFQANNRVAIKVDVIEGSQARIRGINLLGNEAFTREELLDQFALKATHGRLFQSSDRYSRQQLGGDLETLQSYYQDRGFLTAEISSVQVALTPDRDAIYITVNVEEGEIYTVKDTRFSGETIINARFLERFLSTRAGDRFSRRAATESADRIEVALSDIGYAFAKVTPLPEVDEENLEVTLNYLVEPGKRAYVRRIEFRGNVSTNDRTLRREMRQLEAAPFSKSAIERSRVRLSRLPFLQAVEVETVPVPGSDDLVDIVFSMEERPPGSVQFGIGFSGSQGFLVTGQVTHTNFLGTGNRIEVGVEQNVISKSVSGSWTNPYFTQDGISQTVSGFYRESESVIRFSSGFNTNVVGAALTYGIPLSEFSAFRLGAGIDQTAIETFPNASSDEILRFAIENGTKFTNVDLRTGLTFDSRNRTFFATRGALHQLNLDVVIPGSDIETYTLSYRAQHYVPIYRGVFLEINGSAAMIDNYSGDGQVPPYNNFFAGGPRTVRGYQDGSLGPRDTPFDNPFGGTVRTTVQNELVIPLPFEADGKSTRFSLFFDIGSVFAEPRDFDTAELRQSAGVAFQWFTPFLGLLDLSYGFPLNDEVGDEVDRFQISFGSGF